MDSFRGNFFDTYQNENNSETRNQYYDPFFVKHRKRTTKAQLKVLEQTFETNIRPDANLRKKLGEQLGMTPRSVQVWFQNRRAKIKKITQKKTCLQENVDNTGENKRESTSSNSEGSKNQQYNHAPYVNLHRRAPNEEYGVYPMSNSIYKHPYSTAMPRNDSMYDYSYRGPEEYAYVYPVRYPPEYYPQQYQYNTEEYRAWMQNAEAQNQNMKDDEYYQINRKHKQGKGGPYTN